MTPVGIAIKFADAPGPKLQGARGASRPGLSLCDIILEICSLMPMQTDLQNVPVADIELFLLCRGLAVQSPPRRVQLTIVCEELAF